MKARKRAADLKKLNDNQNRLFNIISHDLRSPVAGLQIFLSDTHDTYRSKNSTQVFSSLKMQVGVISNTLNNLLNWSIAQMGGIRPKIQQISLHDCIEHILELSNHLLQYKSITFIKNIEGRFVFADENLTEIVIRNVLNNAIKFTAPGGMIKLSTMTRAGAFVLQIQDSGIGMTASQIKTLFSDRTSTNGTMGEKGSGLGLKLSNDLMALQGGRIEIESIVNEGTTVSLIFRT